MLNFDQVVDCSTWDTSLFVNDTAPWTLAAVATQVTPTQVQIHCDSGSGTVGDAWHLDPSWDGVADGQSGLIT